jgi:hypothetical protein
LETYAKIKHYHLFIDRRIVLFIQIFLKNVVSFKRFH